jgi:Uma2 family endonuclease
MPILIADAPYEEELKRHRAESGADRFDEVWDGVDVRSPLADNEHQDLVGGLCGVLQAVVAWAGLGKVVPGANVSDRNTGWKKNYRIPDVAVFLRDGQARDCDTHWLGGPNLAIEIISPGDLTRDKIPFYATIGTRELLILDRDVWTLELYRLDAATLSLVQKATVNSAEPLVSDVVPLQFQLLAGDDRPRIEVRRINAADRWMI